MFDHGRAHSVTLGIGDTEEKVRDDDEEQSPRKRSQGQQLSL